MQWFRAWANLQRWLEEFEMKHIDFMRSIKSFATMHLNWNELASQQVQPGKAAFARRQSLLYFRLYEDAKSRFDKTAEPRFKNLTEENLVEILMDFRRTELSWLEDHLQR